MTSPIRSLSMVEAAAALGIAASTLRRQAASGILKADKVGRDWLVSPREVERYRREHLGKVGRRSA